MLSKTAVMAYIGSPSAFKELAGLIGAFKFKPDASDLAYQLLLNAFINAAHNLAEENRHNFKTDLEETEKLHDEKEYVQFLDGIDNLIVGEEIVLEYEMLKNPRAIPLLKPFKEYFEAYLKFFGIAESEAKSIANRLPTYFVFELNNEWRKNFTKYEPIQQQLDAPTAEAARKERQWEAYYAYLEREIAMPVFGDSFSLENIYIPLRAYYEYEKADEDEKKIKIKKAIWLSEAMEEWLASNEPENAIKVIEGGPGSGKSSFAKWWAAKLAKERQVRVLFFPLHHFNIHSTIEDAAGNYFNVADHIPINFNPLKDTKEVEQLLLIFDGLDELSKQGTDAKQVVAAFMDELKQFCGIKNQDKARFKVLITGRPIAIQDTQAKLRGNDEQITHLLPYHLAKSEIKKHKDDQKILKADQRNDWWHRFSVLKGLPNCNLPVELKSETLDKITAEPLLNYLVALSWMTAPEKFDKGANINTVYEQLISGVYKRDYDPAKKHSGMADLSEDEFMQILEEIAVCAWQGGDARITTERKIENHIKEKGLENLLDAYKETTKSGVSKLLTAFYFRKYGKEDTEQRDETFEFTHKTLGEYLLAKAIVEMVKLIYEERKLNTEKETGRRSSRKGWSIEDALLKWLEIFSENVLDFHICSFILYEIELRKTKEEPIEAWQDTLCELISEAVHHDMPVHKLDERKKHKEAIRLARNAKESIVVVSSYFAYVTKKLLNINWIDSENQPAIWLNSMSTSFHNRDFVFRNLNHLNLANANLKRINLGNSNLIGADLENANLAGANLRSSNLEGANLINVSLLNAVLEDAFLKSANLENADLENANLEDSVLENVNLKGANLIKANLEGVRINNANLEGVFLNNANLLEAYLNDSSLEGAFLHSTNLEDSTLENVNLERANLTGAMGLTYEQLSATRSLYQTKGIPEEIKDRLLAEKPKLFEKPKD